MRGLHSQIISRRGSCPLTSLMNLFSRMLLKKDSPVGHISGKNKQNPHAVVRNFSSLSLKPKEQGGADLAAWVLWRSKTDNSGQEPNKAADPMCAVSLPLMFSCNKVNFIRLTEVAPNAKTNSSWE